MIHPDAIITCELDFSVQVLDLRRPALSVQVEAAGTDGQTDRRSSQADRQMDRQVQVDSPECVDTVDRPRHVLFVVDVGRLRVEDLEKNTRIRT